MHDSTSEVQRLQLPSNVTISGSNVLFVAPHSGPVYPAICFSGQESANHFNFQAREHSAQFLGPGLCRIKILCCMVVTFPLEYHTCRDQPKSSGSQAPSAPQPSSTKPFHPNNRAESLDDLSRRDTRFSYISDHYQPLARRLDSAEQYIDRRNKAAIVKGPQTDPKKVYRLTADNMAWICGRDVPKSCVHPRVRSSKVHALLLEAYMYQEDTNMTIKPPSLTQEWIFSSGDMCLCHEFQKPWCRHTGNHTTSLYQRLA